MKKHTGAQAIAIILATLTISGSAMAQQKGLGRVDLQKHDLSIPRREAIQVRVDFEPGVTAPRHKHPGEELVYVLEGSLEYRLDGRSPVRLNAGDVLFIPAGTFHEVKNVGSGNAKELATYIVEKNKQLVIPFHP